eukprot:CAMPEP_0178424248 /NCGR_PEP_ID=MMETSP0689_2-20121128/28111_1 /TAXON_ID=160604 /ORGANISM="Amphidinium massartii, Strain CS-259" /LENGTH=955 /DNA_ID=CAMNT_0020045877 /DNA_START=1 /DNA_END=2865 /DNA_ORIENTATION=+
MIRAFFGLGLAILWHAAGALRTASRHQQKSLGARLLDGAHEDIQSWCNATLPLQTGRQEALKQLLAKAEQAAEQDAQLVSLKNEVQHLAVESEAAQRRIEESMRQALNDRTVLASQMRMADVDVEILTKTREKFLASQADLAKKMLARGSSQKEVEGFSVRKQLADLLAAAEGRAKRLHTQMSTANTSTAASAELKDAALKNCTPCAAKVAAESKLKDAEQQYLSAKRSLALSAAALQEEAVYLTDVESICGADLQVYHRLHGEPLRLLREVLERGPVTTTMAPSSTSTARATTPATMAAVTSATTLAASAATTPSATTPAPMAATVATTRPAPPQAESDEDAADPVSEAAATTTAAATTAVSESTTDVPAVEVSTTASTALVAKKKKHAKAKATTTAPSAEPAESTPAEGDDSSLDAALAADDAAAATTAASSTTTARPIEVKKAAQATNTAKVAKAVPAGSSTALGMMQTALDSPMGAPPAIGDPSLPTQYSVWTPLDQAVSTAATDDSSEAISSAGASWAADFKQQLMDDMDGGDSAAGAAAAPAKSSQTHATHKGRHHKKHHQSQEAAPVASTTRAPQTTVDPDDMELTFPPAQSTTAAAAVALAQDDDDLKPQKAPNLGGGLESFLAANSHGRHAKAAAKTPKPDADLQIIQNLYTADGHLPSQYTAWTPTLLQMTQRSILKGARGKGTEAASSEEVALSVLQAYAQQLKSKALHGVSASSALDVRAAQSLRDSLQSTAAGAEEDKKLSEAQQWCSLFEEKVQSASPLAEELHRYESSSISVIEAEAKLAALQEELDTRKELKESTSGDVVALSKLLAKQKQQAVQTSDVGSGASDSFALAAEAVEAVRSEVSDALQGALERRQAAAAAQEKAITELQKELKAATAAADASKKELQHASALLEKSRSKVSGISKTCRGAHHAYLAHQEQAAHEAHALDLVLGLLGESSSG